jgi:hypothetical protein
VLYLNVLLRSDKNKKLENDFVLHKSFDIIVCSPQGDIDDQKVNKSTSISGFEETNQLTSGWWWGLLSKREHINRPLRQ